MFSVKKVILSVLVLFVVFSFTVPAVADQGEKIGTAPIHHSDPVRRIDRHLVSMHKIADHIGYQINWEVMENKVEGYLGDFFFSTSDFIVFRGELFVKEHVFNRDFGIELRDRGNHYDIYLHQPQPVSENGGDLELEVQAHATTVNRNEPIAVSIVLMNNTGEEEQLRFSSGQKFDLVMNRFNRERWRLSDGKGYTQQVIREDLGDREYLLFTTLIEPDVNRGRYNLEAEIITTEKTITSEPVVITVR